jgi:catechol 2,3-dioxygenase-like lactoylglutathione lyase family enzyme
MLEEDRMDAKTEQRVTGSAPANTRKLLRGIHHLALNTDDMRKTLDFYVNIMGMPLVHGLRTPPRPANADPNAGHGQGTPPYPEIAHFFLDMGGDSLLAFFEYPKGVAKPVDRDALGAMQHVSFVCGPKRYQAILDQLKANSVKIVAGPLITIPPAIHSFYFFDPNGIRLEVVADLDGDDDDLQVVQSCGMTETELRDELASISNNDKSWIDGMIAAMSR